MSTPWYGMYPREAEEEFKERERYTKRGPRKPPKHLVRSKEREEADTGGNDLEFLFEVQLDCESKRPYDTPGIDTLLESYTLESDFPAGYTKDAPPQTEEHTGEWFAYCSEI